MNEISKQRPDIRRGFGNAERPLAAELWARDSQAKTAAMLEKGNYEPSHQQVDYKRYYDPEYAKLELEKLFTKTWQFACREEDIPNVGDRIPVNIGALSFFVIRSEPDNFAAFYNACIHRGTKLCDKFGSGNEIRCPFHAWEWHVDGSLKRIPSHWDFTAVTPRNGSLPAIHIGKWGGYIFINADKNPVPFEDVLSVIPAHFKDFKPENRYTKARFRKLLGANWKVSQEAFQESYHVVGTHPEGIPFNGDSQSQYDVFKTDQSHIGRQIVPSAIPSMHAPPTATNIDATMASAMLAKSWHYPEYPLPSLDPAKELRAQLGDWLRAAYEDAYKRKCDLPDGIMMDSTLYFLFPNFAIWLSELIPFVYNFTPHESDPNKSYFEVRLLMPYEEGSPRPTSAPCVEVGIDESIMATAPSFGFLALIFDQDMGNMPLIQAGVKAADPARHHSQLGSYQEIIIQHWHETLDEYMAR
jgi:phenylpropionate dioxygenase-like ring-hydroxylating dioxygenase large terminal subunit